MTRDEAIEIAKAAAKQNPPSYYAEPFEPHPWVVDAIQMAVSPYQTALGYIEDLAMSPNGGAMIFDMLQMLRQLGYSRN